MRCGAGDRLKADTRLRVQRAKEAAQAVRELAAQARRRVSQSKALLRLNSASPAALRDDHEELGGGGIAHEGLANLIQDPEQI